VLRAYGSSTGCAAGRSRGCSHRAKFLLSWLQVNRPADLRVRTTVVAETLASEETVRKRRRCARATVAAEEAIAALPRVSRVLVLRELEDMSYKEIARVADVPIGRW